MLAYLAGTVYFGLKFAGKQKTETDYFVGNKSVHWFMVMASVIATGMSAISLMGVPAQVYQKDLQIAGQFIVGPFIGIPIGLYIIPRIYKLSKFTVYEFLEHRFNVFLRSLGSILFMLGKGFGWLAMVLYVPSLALAEMTGLSVNWCILIIGLLTTGYILKGGIKSVIWADTLQFFVMIAGIFALFYVILSEFGGDVGKIWSIAESLGKTKMVTFSLNFNAEFTIWNIIAGTIFGAILNNATDQIRMQRYLSAKSTRDAIKSMLTGLPIGIVVSGMLYLMGIGLVSYYHTHPDLAATLDDGNQILPHFVINVLPQGLSGLVIAGLFAATMSSVSSGVNSLATSSVVDFYQRFFHKPHKSEQHYMKAGQLMTIIWGIFITVAAVFVGQIGTIFQSMGTVLGFFVGPVVAMYVLGYFSKRTTSEGIFIGSIVAVGIMVTIYFKTSISWMWYGPMGAVFTMALAYPISIFFIAFFGEEKGRWLDRLAQKAVKYHHDAAEGNVPQPQEAILEND